MYLFIHSYEAARAYAAGQLKAPLPASLKISVCCWLLQAKFKELILREQELRR